LLRTGGNPMSYKSIPIDKLLVNRENDRHGELENETTAIAWLFSNFLFQMKKLARDIVDAGQLYEPPLVYPDGSNFIVYDGNRRTTCLKLLTNPKRAPNSDLQKFFADLREQWRGSFPTRITCRVEPNRDEIDEILFRRHTGSQGGVGQSKWDDRMKTTFVNRTGKGGKLNVADEIEERLRAANQLPKGKRIPRSNLNRLLSAEAFRNRVGISTAKGRFQFIRTEDVSLKALARIAHDLAHRRITLDDVWDVDRKSEYLDRLESEGLLPTSADAIQKPSRGGGGKTPKTEAGKPQQKAKKPEKRTTLIPQVDYGIAWAGRLQRQRAIWEELQFKLVLDEHPNAIAVLCRVLLELSVDNYIKQSKLTTASESDALLKKLICVAENLSSQGKINKRYVEVVKKARTMDAIVSVDTLNKYVHSSSLAPAADHLTALWDAFAELVVNCLNE
jgi:hypothetical protein